MAEMSTAERLKTARQLLRDIAWPGLLKADLQAAVDAADTWVDTNAGSFNTALPDPFKTVASAAQKNALIAYVCLRRIGVVTVNGGE